MEKAVSTDELEALREENRRLRQRNGNPTVGCRVEPEVKARIQAVAVLFHRADGSPGTSSDVLRALLGSEHSEAWLAARERELGVARATTIPAVAPEDDGRTNSTKGGA